MKKNYPKDNYPSMLWANDEECCWTEEAEDSSLQCSYCPNKAQMIVYCGNYVDEPETMPACHKHSSACFS